MSPGGVEWAYVTVREDLETEVSHLRVIAARLDEEALSLKHPNPHVRAHLTWAAERVTEWADEAHLLLDRGDGLDHRSALDTALWRRRIAGEFLRAWRGPLGDLWNEHRVTPEEKKAAPMALTKAQAAELDNVLENLDADIAQAAERMQAAERSLTKARDIYARRIENRSILRALRG